MGGDTLKEEGKAHKVNKLTERTITLIRHAKSSWSDPSLADFERPLNKRGMRDAPLVAAALSDKAIPFEKILCSEAQRARQTLDLLKQEMHLPEATIEYLHELYGASAQRLLSCIKEQPDSVTHIALLAHNPGIEELADSLSEVTVSPMPTCCTVQLTFECATWRDLPLHSGKVALHLKPRNLLGRE